MNNEIKKVKNKVSIVNYKALEPYFTEMASKGWMFSEFQKTKLVFCRTEPKDIDFNISLFSDKSVFDYPKETEVIEKEYIETCEECGWNFCAKNGIYNVFYKNVDVEATPLYTDSEEEYRIIKKVFMKTEFMLIWILLLMCYVGMMHFSSFGYETLLNNLLLFSFVSPIVMVVAILYYLSFSFIWFVKNKRNLKNGDSLQFQSFKTVKCRYNIYIFMLRIYIGLLIITMISSKIPINFLFIGFMPAILGLIVGKYCKYRFKNKENSRKNNIRFFVISIILTLFVSMGGLILSITLFLPNYDIYSADNNSDNKILELSDFGVDNDVEKFRMDEQSSLISPINYSYYERIAFGKDKIELDSIETEYIEGYNIALANWIFDLIIQEKLDRDSRWLERDKEYLTEEVYLEKKENNKLISVNKDAWEIDRGYYMYPDKSKIVIQKGEKIYILDGNLDFSNKEIIDICRHKLDI